MFICDDFVEPPSILQESDIKWVSRWDTYGPTFSFLLLDIFMIDFSAALY
jgi:hypothetical protein